MMIMMITMMIMIMMIMMIMSIKAFDFIFLGYAAMRPANGMMAVHTELR